jgi:malate permease and related proteins
VGVLLTIAVIVLSAAIGIAAERRWPDRAGRTARAALVGSLYTLIPFVTFFNLARLEIDADVAGGIAIGYVAIALAALAAWAIGRFLLKAERKTTGAIVCCTLIPNSGYLGYPLTLALLGGGALGEAVAYDILVVGFTFFLAAFATGAAFGDRAGEGVRERLIAFFVRNPPLYAAVVGLLAPDSLATDTLVDLSRAGVIALLPVGFFTLGAMLTEEAEEGVLRLRSPFHPPVAAILGLRLLLAPGLLYLLSLPFIDLPGSYLLLAAMPCGINTLVIGHIYGLDLSTTAQSVAWSTAIVVIAALLAAALGI